MFAPFRIYRIHEKTFVPNSLLRLAALAILITAPLGGIGN